MGQLTLTVDFMGCRRCVREVTAWLRDVPGVQTVAADAGTATVQLGGTMDVADVLAVFTGTPYTPRVLDGDAGRACAAGGSPAAAAATQCRPAPPR